VRTGAPVVVLVLRAAPFLRGLATFDARVREAAGARVLPAFLEPGFRVRFDGISTPDMVRGSTDCSRNRKQ
jgi:hypothetical protein